MSNPFSSAYRWRKSFWKEICQGCFHHLTGNHQSAPNIIGRQSGIQEVFANCLPEDKLNQIGAFQAHEHAVRLIGDSIDDAPSLEKANVGIAMGSVGGNIVVDAADIALVDGEIKERPHLVALSKKMMKTIKLNLTFSVGLYYLAIILANLGVLDPLSDTGSVIVIVISALLLCLRNP